MKRLHRHAPHWLALFSLLACTATSATALAKDRSSRRITTLAMRLPSAIPRMLWWLPQEADEPAGGAPPTADTPEPAEPAPAPTPAPAPAPGPAEAPPGTDADADLDAELVRQAQAAEDAANAEAESGGEVIVVTGSAIERKEVTTAAPVSVVDKEELEASGLVTIGDILQNLPSQSNAINVQFNNGGDGSTRISLRGLGAGRTLVLLNGRRHVPGGTGVDSSVDLNAIPLAVIERVEVLKDGASAIYGSDAIGGVVNIITRNNFKGTEANLYTGTSQRGDGINYDASFVTGQSSARGNVVFSAGYSEQRPIMAGERDFGETSLRRTWATGEVRNDGSITTPQGYINELGMMNEDPVCPSRQCSYDPVSKQWRDFNFGGNSDTGEGDLYNFQPENYLVTPLTRYNVFSLGSYEFHRSARGFFEASYMNRSSEQQLAPEPLSTQTEGIAVSADNIYNPFGHDLGRVNKRMIEAGQRRFAQDLDTFRIVAGVGGQVPATENWKWELAYNYGRTQGTSTKEGLLIRSKVAEALGPSYRDEAGVAHCGTPENPGSPDCVPLDILGGEGSVTPEMLDYLTYTGTAAGFTEQRTITASANGLLVKTPWDGDLRLAAGADYRAEKGAFEPDPITAAGDTTGNKGDPTSGGYNVKGIFSELSFVPITGRQWADWLEVNLAARTVDYDTFGNAFTWKTGALWRMQNGVALRTTYSTAFRAPTIGSLYAGQADSFPRVIDPCHTNGGMEPRDATVNRNCLADGLDENYTDIRVQLPTRVGGNPDLDPETANIITTGIVYEPNFVDNLAFTVDYFHVDVDEAIQAPGADVILNNCYALDNRSDCEKITRDATGLITSISNLQTNIGGNVTAGVDFAVNYGHGTPRIGTFRHNLEGTWLRRFDSVFPARTIDGIGVYDLGIRPKWRFNYSTFWNRNGVGLGTNLRYIHEFIECEFNDCSEPGPRRWVDPNVTGDLFGNYTFKTAAGTSTLAAGINNVLDTNPPLIYNGTQGMSDASAYDFLGRYFYLRFSQLF